MPTNARHRRAGRNFITRRGNALYDGPAPVRLACCNVYWLGLDVGTTWAAGAGDAAYPSRFRVDDALATAAAMGCQVVRAWGMMPSLGFPKALFPDGVHLNEAAGKVWDWSVKRAADYGLRLVVPLVDPWGYYTASPALWSTTLGGSGADFFTNNTVIAGFLAAAGKLVNRVNTFTGLRYGDDPTFLCWETGNEIFQTGAPVSAWTASVAAYLKSQAPRQLVMDGAFGVDPNSLTNANIDIVSDHFYPMNAARLAADLATANLSNKVFAAPEYDWNSQRGTTSTLAQWAAAVNANAATVNLPGWWNLASHGDAYGWAADANNYMGQGGYAYDLTFGSPATQAKALQIRTLAFTYRGLAEGPWPTPGVPLLTKSGSALAWQGVAGSATYAVERSSSSASAGFFTVAAGKTDGDTPWSDPSPPASPVWYRVRGVNPSGAAGPPSNVVQN